MAATGLLMEAAWKRVWVVAWVLVRTLARPQGFGPVDGEVVDDGEADGGDVVVGQEFVEG